MHFEGRLEETVKFFDGRLLPFSYFVSDSRLTHHTGLHALPMAAKHGADPLLPSGTVTFPFTGDEPWPQPVWIRAISRCASSRSRSMRWRIRSNPTRRSPR
jgi:hypothetical protein